MRKDTVRPALEGLVARMGATAFALPASLCMTSYTPSLPASRAQRVLLGLIWISAPTLKNGVKGIFRAPIWEVTAASGLERVTGNKAVRDALEDIRTACLPVEGGCQNMRVFHDVRVMTTSGQVMVEWVFEPDVADMFISPSQYALLDIRDLAKLTTSAEIFLYIQLRRIWRRRVRRLVVSIDDLGDAYGTPGQERRRIVEKLKRTLTRLSGIFEEDVRIAPASHHPGKRDDIVIIEPKARASAKGRVASA